MLKKKVIITSAIVGTLLFIGGKCFASSTGVVNTETVNLRAKASTDANIVTLLSQDDKVEIIEEDGEWYKVKAGEKTGYIYAKYVTKKGSTDNEKTATSTEKEESTEKTETDDTEDVKKEETKSENKTEITIDDLAINSQVKILNDVEIKLIPLINSNVIGKIPGNTTVFVLDYINGWYYVSSDNVQGWVRKEKLSTEKQETQEQKTEEKYETEEKKDDSKEENKETETTKYVNVEKVNIRKSASTSSDVLKTISKNTKVTVYSTSDGWSKVKVDGTEGYISSEFLSNSKVSEENTTNRSLKESREEVVNQVSSQSAPAQASGNGQSVVDYAKSYLGKPYVSGGAGPNSFDCSGFTQYVYKNYGVSLSHSASAQAYVGTEVNKSDLQPGDIVVFKGETGSGVGHVGIYIGNDQFIHASNPSDGVKITSLSSDYYTKRYVTSRRVL